LEEDMPKKTVSTAKAKQTVKKIERVAEREIKKDMGQLSASTPTPAAPVPVPEPTDVEPVIQNSNQKVLEYASLNYSLAYLRSKPSRDGRILKHLTRGTKLTLLTPDINGWTRVEVGDGEEPKVRGYVQTVFLKSEKEA
jgi:uncharacterized protein YgiM (DUF1202 family)